MKLSTSRLIKRISEYKFVITSLGIKTQAHPPKLLKHSLKLNKTHTRVIVPIISYACQVWYPSKCDLVLIERIKKSTTKWIRSLSLTYKERLIKLKIQPLSFYFKIHRLLLLCDLINNKYNIVIEKNIHFNNNHWTRQGAKCKIKLTKNDYSKATKISCREQPISIILSTNTQTLQTTKI